MTVRPFSLCELLAIRLQIWADCDRVRDGLVKMLATTPEEAPGRKQLLQCHRRGERLRRELFGMWYEDAAAGATLLKEPGRHV